MSPVRAQAPVVARRSCEPTRAARRCRLASAQEFDRVDRAVVAPELAGAAGACGAARRRRCAPIGGRCAAAWHRPPRRRASSASEIVVVADHHRPLDERLVAELLLAVVGRCRRGLARHAHPGADQALGTDELDAEALQLGGRDVEEVLGDVEVELDLRRFVFEREVGEARDERDPASTVCGDQHRSAGRGGGLRGRRRARCRCASHTSLAVHQRDAVAVVDEFEPHDPRSRAGRRGSIKTQRGERRPARRRARRRWRSSSSRSVLERDRRTRRCRRGPRGRASASAPNVARSAWSVGACVAAEVGLPAVWRRRPRAIPSTSCGEHLVDVDAGPERCRSGASMRRARRACRRSSSAS